MSEQRPQRSVLDAHERRILEQIAQVALPAGERFPAAGDACIDRVEALLSAFPSTVIAGFSALLRTLDTQPILRYGRKFSSLGERQRVASLQSWRKGSAMRRLALKAALTPLKIAHFDDPEFFRSVGCVYEFPAVREQPPRYIRDRSHHASDLEEDLELEVEVVVVGSGAGGAVVAKELAEKGHAVAIVEEGGFFTREDFNGRCFELQQKMYRSGGVTFSVGNVGIPIPVGRTVGGSTTVNSGTCFRVPDRIIEHWRTGLGLTEFTPDGLAPYFDKVEGVLGVARADRKYVGKIGDVIARGCDALGYRHAPLLRNAPDCDGKGVCVFGCPTDAKRSTNVSYVPLALRAGAELFYGARVDSIMTEGDRAVGVMARSVNQDGDDTGRTLRIRAQKVVIACGALTTPVFLRANGLCKGSDQLGRNLSIHPAVAILARFNEDISPFNAIPQGYSIEEFHDEGLLYEGYSAPLDVGMAAMPFLGRRLIDLAENYDRVAAFGLMIEDTSRGRIRMLGGKPVITYYMNDRDVARLKRGIEIMMRVYLAAGATKVYPLVHGFDEIANDADMRRFQRANLRARDFELSAYHPLGTARMGRDPRSSVVGPSHEAHEVQGLYVVDGSAVPSSLAVNPQVTIMALATRAADEISKRIR